MEINEIVEKLKELNDSSLDLKGKTALIQAIRAIELCTQEGKEISLPLCDQDCYLINSSECPNKYSRKFSLFSALEKFKNIGIKIEQCPRYSPEDK